MSLRGIGAVNCLLGAMLILFGLRGTCMDARGICLRRP